MCIRQSSNLPKLQNPSLKNFLCKTCTLLSKRHLYIAPLHSPIFSARLMISLGSFGSESIMRTMEAPKWVSTVLTYHSFHTPLPKCRRGGTNLWIYCLVMISIYSWNKVRVVSFLPMQWVIFPPCCVKDATKLHHQHQRLNFTAQHTVRIWRYVYCMSCV